MSVVGPGDIIRLFIPSVINTTENKRKFPNPKNNIMFVRFVLRAGKLSSELRFCV